MSDKPRVMLTMPSGGSAHPLAVQSHYALATMGKTSVMPALPTGPAATHNHNNGFGIALHLNEQGLADYWVCHHADIAVNTLGWADVMVDEMKRTGAAALSAVIPIKDDAGLSSTAIERERQEPERKGQPQYFNPRVMTMRECWDLPQTFCRDDVPNQPEDLVGGPLLINTGLLMVDLSRPEFHQVNVEDDGKGSLEFLFTLVDRITLAPPNHPIGKYLATFAPDDWNFARLCHKHNLPVYATRIIDCDHYGLKAWSNQPPKAA